MLQNNNIKATTHVCPQYAALAANPKRNPTAAAILSAITDIIQMRVQQQQQASSKKITPTHYFATLMTALDEGNPSDRQDCMFLLKLLLPHVSKGVLQSKFVAAMDVFSNVLNDSANPESLTNSLIKHLIECIGLVLAAQPCAPTFWAQPKTLQSFNAILNLIIDERPKIRKSSHEAIRILLRNGHGKYLSNNIVTCLEQILKSATQKNCKPVLIILPLIQDVLPYLLDDDDNNSNNNNNKKKTGKSLKETSAGRLIFALLRTQAFLSDNKFSELTFRSFQNSVVPKQLDGNANAITTTKWSTDLLHLFLNTLMDLRPGHQQQVQVGESYLPLLADAMVCMYRGNKNVSMNLLPRAVTTIQTFFDSTNTDVHRWACEAMARLCVHCIDENEVIETNITLIKEEGMNNNNRPTSGKTSPKRLLPLQSVVQTWADLFLPRYRHARRVIVPFAQGVFEHFNTRAYPILNPIVNMVKDSMDEERQKGGANVTSNDKKEMEEALWEIVDANDHSDSDSDEDDAMEDNNNKYNNNKRGKGPNKHFNKNARRLQKMKEKMKEKEELTEALIIDRFIGSIIKAYGPQNFFTIVPIGNINIEGFKETNESLQLLDKRLWTLPLLKKYLFDCINFSDTKLKMFKEYILVLALQCERATRTDGVTNVVKNVMQTRVQQLWSLFPSFCSNASDIAEVLPTLGPMLGNAMRDGRYPRMQQSVCLGIEILCKNNNNNNNNDDDSEIKNNKLPNNNEGGDDDDDDNDEQKERKTINVATLTKFAPNFFPILFAGYEQTNAQEFLNVIKTYVVFASKELIENMGNQVIKKLIQSTINLSENHATASLMLGLATVLTPKLSVKQRDVLYKAITPCLNDNAHGNVQKRGYKVLAALCEHHSKQAAIDNFEWLSNVGKSIVNGIGTSSVAGKRMRLLCVGFIIKGLDLTQELHQQLFLETLGEVVMCLKEQNTRARNAAFDCLIIMAEQMVSVNLLETFFDMVSAGLAGKTPHFRSATITALSRLYYKYGKELSNDKTTTLVETVVILFQTRAREEVASLISFCKSVSTKCPSRFLLAKLLKPMVDGMLRWKDDTKNRFKSKIRGVIELMVQRCGLEQVRKFVPEDDQPLMNYIDRQARKLASKKSKNKGKYNNKMQLDDADWNDEIVDGNNNIDERKKMSNLRDDEDLTSTFALKQDKTNGRKGNKNLKKRRRREEEERLEIGADGKMIVPNDEEDDIVNNNNNNNGDGNDDERLRRDMLAMINEKTVHEKSGYGANDGGGGGKRRKKNGKQNNTGMESGKAGGQAYAYIKMGKNFNTNFKSVRGKKNKRKGGGGGNKRC